MHTASMDPDEVAPAPLWANVVAGITRRLPIGKSRAIEFLCRGSSKRFLGRMSRQLGGYSFDCCLRDWLAREVFFGGCAAAPEIAFIRAVLRPGMSFVDVGANWGLCTLAAAHFVGNSGKVTAIEADPRIFAKLESNVRRNNLQQVLLFDIAIADRESTLSLAAHDQAGDNWGISKLVEHSSTDQLTFKVSSRKLDSLLNEASLDNIDLLKIDVEGAEDMVLNGMADGLTRQRYRRILLELHPMELGERGRTVYEIADTLIAKGYKGYALDYSPAAKRKAYYHPWLHFSEFLKPLKQVLADPAPHTIWLCPDEPALTSQ
jgi:FkbM family methyltransferase